MSPPPQNPYRITEQEARTPPPGDKREAILAAALDLFVERGYHGTAVPSIADHAGVGAGTIYRYFTDKPAIVNALYQKYKTEITGLVLRDFPVDKPARQLIQHLWSRLTEFAIGNPRAFAFLELHHHADYLDKESVALENRILDLGVRLLLAAQLRGEVKPGNPMLLLSIVHGAFVGVIRKAWEGLLDLSPEMMGVAEQCAWEAIRA